MLYYRWKLLNNPTVIRNIINVYFYILKNYTSKNRKHKNSNNKKSSKCLLTKEVCKRSPVSYHTMDALYQFIVMPTAV